MTARTQRAGRDDTGMTLLELIVAMGIASILIAAVVATFTSVSRGFSDQQGAIDNSRLASTAMNEVTRILRSGTEIPKHDDPVNDPVFEYAGAEKVVVHAFIDSTDAADPAPLKVQFARNSANELVETRWTAYRDHVTYWKFNATSNYSRTIARSLMPPVASSPVFTYFDKNGGVLTPASGASLTPAQITNVASVQVTMRVQADESGRVAPVMIQNMVGLPNLGVARVEVH